MSQYPRRRTTGAPQIPSGARPPTGGHARPHHHVERSGSGGATMWIIVGVLALAGIGFFAMRDTWEQDNRAQLLDLRRDAQAARQAAKKIAYQKYDAIVQRVGNRRLRDSELYAAYEEARTTRAVLLTEMAAEEQALADARSKGVAPIKLTPAELKANEAAYVKYEEKTRPLMDAFGHTKALVEVGADPIKYAANVADLKAEYDRWYQAITNEEAAHPSAHLMKVVLESYRTASDWWAIETQKKMPDALYAGYMRKNEWSRADSALERIKRCMASKDVVERKKCSPCDGTGKLKCIICEGSGVCAYCKGKGGTQITCCTNGVCDACKGRKETTCLICNGGGVFPRK